MRYLHCRLLAEAALRSINVIVVLIMLLLCSITDVLCGPLAAEEKVASAEETAASSNLHLPFWDAQDVVNPLGPLKFQAEPLQKEGLADGYPPVLFGCEVPLSDGNAWVYGWKLTGWQDRATRTVEVVRAMTRDGVTFSGEETVLKLVNSDWQGFVNIVRRPTDGRLFFFCWSAGHLQVYSSDDGLQWNRLTESAYVGHDAMNVIWYPPFQEFVNFQNTLQKTNKRYPDNIGEYRRVLSFRRSADGVVWNGFSPPFLKGAEFWAPDEQDPVDLEFYRSIVFPTQGRYAMLLQDYIAPPPEANSRRGSTKHGPRSEVEWAISRDGLNWDRPFRDQDATSQVFSLPVQGPLLRDGVFRFYERDRVITRVTEGRLFFVTGRGNCEFSTPDFAMPENGLTIDANVLYHPAEGLTGRSYLMAELRDENDQIIAGYDRGRCLYENQDGQTIPLQWENRNGSELAGRRVRLRFFFRDARLYSVSQN